MDSGSYRGAYQSGGMPMPVMPSAYPPIAEDMRQQLQSKLPFQQESGRTPPTPVNMQMSAPAPPVMPAAFPSSLQSQVAMSGASEEEFRERLQKAARSIETKIKVEVEECHGRMRRELMYLGGVVALLIAVLMWRSFRK